MIKEDAQKALFYLLNGYLLPFKLIITYILKLSSAYLKEHSTIISVRQATMLISWSATNADLY